MNILPNLAFYIAKVIQFFLIKLGRGRGMALPGLVAERISPRLLTILSKQLKQGVIIVIGTNGKTTTSRLIASILEGDGYQVVHNRTGSNLLRGTLSSLISSSDWRRRLVADWAVLEVDEAYFPIVANLTQPQTVVVLNLFNDQLDRYGDLANLHQLWQQACQNLPSSCTLILNTDDPLVNSLSLNSPANVIGYSLDSSRIKLSQTEHYYHSRRCPRCGSLLEYQSRTYSHLGRYVCPNNDYSPTPARVVASNVDLRGLSGSSYQLNFAKQSLPMNLNLGGLYNIYNALAANATAISLGVDDHVIQERTENFQAVFGRLEKVRVGQTTMTLVLVKNSTSFNQVLQTIASQNETAAIWVSANDTVADGRDMSWLWDIDWSKNWSTISQIIISGTRRTDLQLSLKYAGADSQLLHSASSLSSGLRYLNAAKPDRVYCLFNYSAMNQLRQLLKDHRLIAAAEGSDS